MRRDKADVCHCGGDKTDDGKENTLKCGHKGRVKRDCKPCEKLKNLFGLFNVKIRQKERALRKETNFSSHMEKMKSLPMKL
jgi:hypothetical protein